MAAFLRPHYDLLEFGAGRGASIAGDPSPYRRNLQMFRGRCRKVRAAAGRGTVRDDHQRAQLRRFGKPAARASLAVRAQPGRSFEDVFRAPYRMNTRRRLRCLFGCGTEVTVYPVRTEPRYHFGKVGLYRIFAGLHRILPGGLLPTLHVIARKL